MEDSHAREHGEIITKLDTLGDSVQKLSNGKMVDYMVKGSVVVLSLLELQTRTGIEIGQGPEGIIRSVLALVG